MTIWSVNEPLTLNELREMDGEPVFLVPLNIGHPSDGLWALVDLEHELCWTAKGGMAVFENYGKTWIAYRHKPEGVAE